MDFGALGLITVILVLSFFCGINIRKGFVRIRNSGEPFRLAELFHSHGEHGPTGSQLIRLGLLEFLGALYLIWLLLHHTRLGRAL